MKRVALYFRSGLSDNRMLDAQRLALAKFAVRKGWRIVAMYEDGGVDGYAPLHERPSGNRLLQQASARSFDAVLVTTPDRLARDPQLFSRLYQELRAWDVRVEAIDPPYQPVTYLGFNAGGHYGRRRGRAVLSGKL